MTTTEYNTAWAIIHGTLDPTTMHPDEFQREFGPLCVTCNLRTDCPGIHDPNCEINQFLYRR